jgi:threonyl-tRNA synthetase
MKNIAGKEETAFTVQYDFVGPKRFAMSYIDKDGTKQEPIVIHRSSIGAIERTLAFLIEHYAGALPVWLMPVQVTVLPIGKDHKKYAKEIGLSLREAGIRVEVNDADESVGKKIRESELQKIPYILVIGDKEVKSKSISVRQRGKGDLGKMKLKKFISGVCDKIKNKK